MTNLARMCYQASRGLYGAQARNIGPQWGPGHAGEGGRGRQGWRTASGKQNMLPSTQVAPDQFLSGPLGRKQPPPCPPPGAAWVQPADSPWAPAPMLQEPPPGPNPDSLGQTLAWALTTWLKIPSQGLAYRSPGSSACLIHSSGTPLWGWGVGLQPSHLASSIPGHFLLCPGLECPQQQKVLSIYRLPETRNLQTLVQIF